MLLSHFIFQVFVEFCTDSECQKAQHALSGRRLVMEEIRNEILPNLLLSGSVTELSSRVTSIQTNIIAESFKNIPTTLIFLFEI